MDFWGRQGANPGFGLFGGAAPSDVSWVTRFRPPAFDAEPLSSAPDARFVPAPADGVLPDGFFSTTNLPTYVRIGGLWRLPLEPRMDSGIVLGTDGLLRIREGRRVAQGDLVVVGDAEDGSEGVFVHMHAFVEPEDGSEFRFMTSEVSREKPIDYRQMALRLLEQRDAGGYVAWVAGPALVPSRARTDMTWFVDQGFVQVLLAGNAVAVHDIDG